MIYKGKSLIYKEKSSREIFFFFFFTGTQGIANTRDVFEWNQRGTIDNLQEAKKL